MTQGFILVTYIGILTRHLLLVGIVVVRYMGVSVGGLRELDTLDSGWRSILTFEAVVCGRCNAALLLLLHYRIGRASLRWHWAVLRPAG